jgi:hypothetical protein
MKKKMNSSNSVISLVYNAWGCFYRGGTYILLGKRKRKTLWLHYACESAKAVRFVSFSLV